VSGLGELQTFPQAEKFEPLVFSIGEKFLLKRFFTFLFFFYFFNFK
jgi:hypothetical protein